MGICEINVKGVIKARQMMKSSPISDTINLAGLMINLWIQNKKLGSIIYDAIH